MKLSIEELIMAFTPRQEKLLQFVKRAHGDQIRKYTSEPYWHHVVQVGVIAETFVEDRLLLEVGLCHDLFEDTKVTKEELMKFLIDNQYNQQESLFILNGAYALTDRYTKETAPGRNRLLRKQMEANRLSTIHYLYQTVKYADLLDNSETIFRHDENFAKTFVLEMEFILQKMRHGDIDLFVACWNITKEAKAIFIKA